MDLLDQALLDRHISATEADALVATAEMFGLARADVEHLHRTYLASLAGIALEDGILTPTERHDLDEVAGLLGLQQSDVDRALAAAATTIPQQRRPDAWRLQPGDTVVFTGAMEPPRWEWEEQARAAGLQVGNTVTKKTRRLEPVSKSVTATR
ncbi:hypothetical protein DLJ46_16025 [Micromonospora globispora]|uniref:Uncharacterized protein n=2 Tax=Micromonospora globispora TaxID=1450148 RepID=A0A317K2E4_9ACTN|nr:hypothetical protein DLJ46_16025 [Micromonospora globispora]